MTFQNNLTSNSLQVEVMSNEQAILTSKENYSEYQEYLTTSGRLQLVTRRRSPHCQRASHFQTTQQHKTLQGSWSRPALPNFLGLQSDLAKRCSNIFLSHDNLFRQREMNLILKIVPQKQHIKTRKSRMANWYNCD